MSHQLVDRDTVRVRVKERDWPEAMAGEMVHAVFEQVAVVPATGVNTGTELPLRPVPVGGVMAMLVGEPLATGPLLVTRIVQVTETDPPLLRGTMAGFEITTTWRSVACATVMVAVFEVAVSVHMAARPLA